jgi:hypothetical protein
MAQFVGSGSLTTPSDKPIAPGERKVSCLLSRLPLILRKQDQRAQGKETRYDVTRLDIPEAFEFAGPRVSPTHRPSLASQHAKHHERRSLLHGKRRLGCDRHSLGRPLDELQHVIGVGDHRHVVRGDFDGGGPHALGE